MSGLRQKFRVERTDGRYEEKDHFARYFVLNFVGDRHARTAVAAYAEACREDYPQLSADLMAALAESEADFHRFGLHHDCEQVHG